MYNEYTKKVIKDFLKYYGSVKVYENAIKHLFIATEKSDVKSLTYQDYLYVKGDKSQDAYRTSFFKYIYAFDIVDNNAGFENIGVKVQLRKEFEDKLKKKLKPKERKVYKPSLSIEQIEKIETFLNVEDADNSEILLLGFCWYILFLTDCPVDEFRYLMDTKYYEDGMISSESGKIYEVPSRFHGILIDIKNKKNNRTGFADLGLYITKLGNYVGIDNLTPKRITKARDENKLTCSECGEAYPNLLSNWISANNRVVCKGCADKLKKNFLLVDIENRNIEVTSTEQKAELEYMSYTFKTLRDKIIKERDYIELHKLQCLIGKLGEVYVYETERTNLKDTPYFDKVDNTKALDPQNGYDILSYDKNGNEIYIEVKSTNHDESDFILSNYELNTYKKLTKQGKIYLIYRVSNILSQDTNDIKLKIIDNLLTNKKYKLQVFSWKILIKGAGIETYPIFL